MSQTIEQLKEQLSAMSVVAKIGWTPKRAGSKDEDSAFAKAIEADEGYVGTYKHVIDEDMEEWRALLAARQYVKWYWENNSFEYVVPKQRLFYRDRRKEIVGELTKCHEGLKEKGKALDAKRKDIIEWAKGKFPTTFDESVYPKSWAALACVTWSEHNMDPPKYLERDDAEEYKRELQRQVAGIDSSMKMFERQCYTRMGEVAYNFSQALAKEGNKGITPAVKGMMELFDKVHQMRFEGTAAFQKCLRETKALIEGVELEEIKKPGGIRDDVKKRLEEIIKKNKKLNEQVTEKANSKEKS